MIHKEVFQSPSGTHEFIKRFIVEIDMKTQKETRAPTEIRRTMARPRAPPRGYAKIHVDASVAKSKLRGEESAVCGDDDGRYLGSSSLVIQGIIDVATLEAMACREVLALAEDLMIQNVIIASDSKQVVNGIERGSSSTYGCIISQIKQ